MVILVVCLVSVVNTKNYGDIFLEQKLFVEFLKTNLTLKPSFLFNFQHGSSSRFYSTPSYVGYRTLCSVFVFQKSPGPQIKVILVFVTA